MTATTLLNNLIIQQTAFYLIFFYFFVSPNMTAARSHHTGHADISLLSGGRTMFHVFLILFRSNRFGPKHPAQHTDLHRIDSLHFGHFSRHAWHW